MGPFRRAPMAVIVASLSIAASSFAGQGNTLAPGLTPTEMETFLLEALITHERGAGAGVTGSIRVTMSDGRFTHDAHVQSVDIAKPMFQAGKYSETNFKDAFRFNVAAYRLARLLEIKTVPMSVERNVDGKASAVTWWVDDVQMDEKTRVAKRSMGPNPLRTSHQFQLMYIWDELIQNRDRNPGNIVWTGDWTMWLIDHTRAFRLGKDLLEPKRLMRCDRGLLARLKALTEDSVEMAVGDSLMKSERQAVLVRRDRIVKLIEGRAAQLGESAVLFDF